MKDRICKRKRSKIRPDYKQHKSLHEKNDRTRKRKKDYIRKIKRAWEENINDFEWSFLSEAYLLILIVVSTRFKYAEVIFFVLTVIVEQTAEAIRNRAFIATISTEDWKILKKINADALKHLRQRRSLIQKKLRQYEKVLQILDVNISMLLFEKFNDKSIKAFSSQSNML